MATRDSSELDKAVEEWREERAPEQPALFEEAAAVPMVRGKGVKGRPPGSRNLRSEAYAALLRGRHGDPLDIATRIAAKDVLDREVVRELAEVWGCSRFDAVKLWAKINADTQPFHHQRLPQAHILNPGAPGGERVLLEIDGEFRDVTPPEDSEDEAA